MKKVCAFILAVMLLALMAIPAFAAPAVLEETPVELTFGNGVTINFPFTKGMYATMVAFAGVGAEVVYILEAPDELLQQNNIIGLMGVRDYGTYQTADLGYKGTCYVTALEVVNGYADYQNNVISYRQVFTSNEFAFIFDDFVCPAVSWQPGLTGAVYGPGDEFMGMQLVYPKYNLPWPSNDIVIETLTIHVPQVTFYPGAEYQFQYDLSGQNIVPGSPESTVYWYVHGNTSADTYIDNNGLLTIANDETASALEIEAVSTYDTTKSDSVVISVSYPLFGSMVAPSGTQTFVESSKRQEVQFELILPNGEPFNYTDIEWTIRPSSGASSYFRIDDQGLLVIEPNAPAGSSCTVHFAYGFDTDNVSAAGATVKIVSTQEGIYDNLTPTPEQNDKAEEMEDAIGDAADKLENNNSSLGQLTPTRPQINTNLEFDQDQMLAVSPLVTNIWSINGLGRMISVVLVVATVAYIFFGKRDG